MALSADAPRTYAAGYEPHFTSLPCTSNVTIYEGSAVGQSTTAGTFRALVAADTFAGFAHEQVINPSSGTKRVKVRQVGVARLAVTGATAVTGNTEKVYASADGTFTMSATGNSYIGKIVQWVSSGVADVYFKGEGVKIGDT